jgi:hypothetical protein
MTIIPADPVPFSPPTVSEGGLRRRGEDLS